MSRGAESFAERFRLPKEHGGWALLAVPPLAGFAAAGGTPLGACVLFFLAALGAYLVRRPLEEALKKRGERRPAFLAAAYSAGAAAGFLPLILLYGRSGLLYFACAGAAGLALQVWLDGRRLSRSAAGEFFGIGVLALGAPAAHYASRGDFLSDGFLLWLLCSVFFAGPVFYVRMVVAGHIASAAKDKDALKRFESARSKAIAYHAGAFAFVSSLALGGFFPALAVAPFLLALGKTAYRATVLPAAADLRRVGWQEVVSSLVFAVFVAGAFAG